MDYGTTVELLASTELEISDRIPEEASRRLPDAEALIEYSGRLCWDTTEKTGQVENRISKWIEVGHESLLEHASMTFFIEGSRAFTHQLVRHRIASYSQRSQRYVKETEPSYFIPPQIKEDPEILESYKGLMSMVWAVYGNLLKKGIKADQARYVLPNATRTQIVVTMNLRELRHFIALRTSKKASEEMQEIANKIKDICKRVAPEVFKDI